MYLSQVALITILAQVGSCVPAKKAKLEVIRSINSRISSFESVTHGQSSFFEDASQVSTMLVKNSGTCLNLIDEFGKGTAETDGMALLTSVLRALLRHPLEGAPLSLCTTHFVEILREPFLPLSDARLGLFSMEIMAKTTTAQEMSEINSCSLRVSKRKKVGPVSKRSGALKSQVDCEEGQGEPISGNIGTVVRTYKIQAGTVCDESRALQCALEAGIPKSILERAAHIHAAISREGKVEKTVACESNNARIQSCAAAVREFLSKNLEDETISCDEE